MAYVIYEVYQEISLKNIVKKHILNTKQWKRRSIVVNSPTMLVISCCQMKMVNSIYFHFFLSIFFSLYFLFSDLGLEVSIISHISHTEHHRRPQNNDVIQHVLHMLFRVGQVNTVWTMSLVYKRQTDCTQELH